MAVVDRSHLMPVTTVDKNGRQTTVYRKPAASGGKANFFPVLHPQHRQRSDEQVERMYTRIHFSDDVFLRNRYRGIVRGLSEEDYGKAEELLDLPLSNEWEGATARGRQLIKILDQGGGYGWRLDGALLLARAATPLSTDCHLAFINMLARDERFKNAVRHLQQAGENVREDILAVAAAMAEINKKYMEHQKHLSPFERSWFVQLSNAGDQLKFDNQSVADALLDHPGSAQLVTRLFLERGSVEALDEALANQTLLADGTL